MNNLLLFCLSAAILLPSCTPKKASEKRKAYTVSDLTGKYRGSFVIMCEECNPYAPYLDACELEIQNDGKSYLRVYSGGKVKYELQGKIEEIRAKQLNNAYGEPNGQVEYSFKWKHSGGDPLKYFDSRSSWKEKGWRWWEYIGNAKYLWGQINSRNQILIGYDSKEFNRVQ